MNIIILLLSTILHIASASEPGQRMILSGTVFGPDGKPRAGVEIYAYHTDAAGLYHRGPDGPPRLQGRLRTAADGSYVIDTIKPGPYPGTKDSAHMHFKIGGQEETIFFDRNPRVPLVRGADGVLHGRHDFHLRGGAK